MVFCGSSFLGCFFLPAMSWRDRVRLLFPRVVSGSDSWPFIVFRLSRYHCSLEGGYSLRFLIRHGPDVVLSRRQDRNCPGVYLRVDLVHVRSRCNITRSTNKSQGESVVSTATKVYKTKVQAAQSTPLLLKALRTTPYSGMVKSSSEVGGIKGFFQKAGKSFYACGIFAKDTTWWLAVTGARIGFIVATTSMVTLMPLLFEIGREGQMLETERIQVKEYRSRGYSDRQLQEMGFAEAAVHSPSVAAQKL